MLSMRRAIAAGVPIAMGTDAATPYNFHGHNGRAPADGRCRHDAAAGTDSLDAERRPRDRLGFLAWLGRGGQGRRCAVVLRENPLDDLRTLADQRNIELVIKDGQVVARRPHTSDRDVPEQVMASAWICCGIPIDGRGW